MVVELQNTVAKCALRLASLVKSNGKFRYEFPHSNPAKESKRYNWLRHFGTVWSMALAHNFTENPDVLEKARLAFASGIKRNMNSSGQIEDQYGNIKLGGGALALLAACALQDTHKERELLAQGLWSMHGKRKDFIHKITPAGPSNFVSDYYTGEAVFALIAFYKNLKWSTAIPEGDFKIQEFLRSLLNSEYGVSCQSHWMAYAATERNYGMEEQVKYCKTLQAEILRDDAYFLRNKANPIACRSEALAIMYPWVGTPESKSVLERNLERQLTWVKENGDIVEGNSSDLVRIDTIQHNMTSFINYIQYVV